MFDVNLTPDRHRSALQASEACFASLMALVVDCQNAGFLRRSDARTTARMAWAQVHGLAELARRKQFALENQKEVLRLADRATEALLDGMEVRQ
jgi:hypothetical protein